MIRHRVSHGEIDWDQGVERLWERVHGGESTTHGRLWPAGSRSKDLRNYIHLVVNKEDRYESEVGVTLKLIIDRKAIHFCWWFPFEVIEDMTKGEIKEFLQARYLLALLEISP